MPLYVVTIERQGSPPERVEVELSGPDQVHLEASLTIAGMLREAGRGFWDKPAWRLEVADDAGTSLCAVSLQGTMGDPSR